MVFNIFYIYFVYALLGGHVYHYECIQRMYKNDRESGRNPNVLLVETPSFQCRIKYLEPFDGKSVVRSWGRDCT